MDQTAIDIDRPDVMPEFTYTPVDYSVTVGRRIRVSWAQCQAPTTAHDAAFKSSGHNTLH
jgi:hypothetical protein